MGGWEGGVAMGGWEGGGVAMGGWEGPWAGGRGVGWPWAGGRGVGWPWVGWEGGGVAMGGVGGGEPQAGQSKHSDTNGSAVPSVGDPAGHNSPGRPSLPSESVWHPMQSY